MEETRVGAYVVESPGQSSWEGTGRDDLPHPNVWQSRASRW